MSRAFVRQLSQSDRLERARRRPRRQTNERAKGRRRNSLAALVVHFAPPSIRASHGDQSAKRRSLARNSDGGLERGRTKAPKLTCGVFPVPAAHSVSERVLAGRRGERARACAACACWPKPRLAARRRFQIACVRVYVFSISCDEVDRPPSLFARLLANSVQRRRRPIDSLFCHTAKLNCVNSLDSSQLCSTHTQTDT